MTFKTISALWLLALLLVSAPASWAQMKVRVNWCPPWRRGQSGFRVAHEDGIFKKNGLEVELLHIPSSSRAIQTMLAGEIAISYLDPRNTIEANFQGRFGCAACRRHQPLHIFIDGSTRDQESRRPKGQKDRRRAHRLFNSHGSAVRTQPGGSQALPTIRSFPYLRFQIF